MGGTHGSGVHPERDSTGDSARDPKAVAALREIVLRQMGQRFGTVPEEVRHKVEAIEEIEPLADLAKKVLEVRSLDDMGLS